MQEGLSGVKVEKGVMRVLVVDDSPVDRQVAQLLLSSNSFACSFHVITVDSARKAMEFLRLKDCKEQAIHMVLTDYCMPGMTGYDLLKAMKATTFLKTIPVVIMSSENKPERISQCLDAGAEDFILKPLRSKDVQRLWNCISNAVPKDFFQGDGMPLPPPSTAAAVPPSGRPARFAGVTKVLHSSCMELSKHFFPLLLKLALLVYAVLCLGELLHGWS